MVQASQQLLDVRDLLEQALRKIDALDETFIGALIDTALQDVHAKIETSKADE